MEETIWTSVIANHLCGYIHLHHISGHDANISHHPQCNIQQYDKAVEDAIEGISRIRCKDTGAQKTKDTYPKECPGLCSLRDAIEQRDARKKQVFDLSCLEGCLE